ncbi:PRC-barrel domain-containing protein [Pelagibacterium flavum]|uniref:PRC-barrel domain-containing protein n=1 Tax=Pelagibacterium flavum TaxID=2984530 RepID=A0ABY6IXI2_9HYPH|nr:PRC-barrel domain-containing protein [Pelagibacterium sp. YIM 151497]UYQ73987.1 PRC-barrel domain-containing protein [Pelagibacterium sp. YIM 151497]|tara:strand:+ start:528 stop:929 length:402 start_codon:yes stop_codon:yes gene_type:complete
MDPRTDNGLRARDLDRRETGNLIGSDKVEGTAVYSLANDKIGTIERVMIDKLSGKVGYAVLSFGGFLGIGDDHYPIPWAKLTYDESLGGYRTDISKADLDNAPRYNADDDFEWNDRQRAMDIYTYYGVPPYWI